MSLNNAKNNDYYLYKAKKYHYKIKQKLLEMKKNGKGEEYLFLCRYVFLN